MNLLFGGLTESDQVLSLQRGCKLRGLALSASDKLRVTTLDSAKHKGSVFSLAMHDALLKHTVLPGVWECHGVSLFCGSLLQGCVTRKLCHHDFGAF